MEKDDVRFSLSPDKYLEKTRVMVYLEDAISQLLDHKDDNPKVNPTLFFTNYFESVKAGNHILLREFSFVKATPHNRSSFVRAFWKCFCNIGRKGDLLSIREYHSLACLICMDFPLTLFQKTAKIILMDASSEDSLISFMDFIYAFQLQFCFDEFLTKSSEVYRSMLQNSAACHLDAVVVPTSEKRPLQASLEASKNDRSNLGVDAMQFFRVLSASCEQLDNNCPPVNLIHTILSEKERISFFEFLANLSKNAKLNEVIGKLPQRSELFAMSDQEMNLTSSPPAEKFWAEDAIVSSPCMQTASGSGTKFTQPQNPSSLEAPCLSNRGRPTGTSRTESVKSAEPGRWVSSSGQDGPVGLSTGSSAKGRSSAFRKNSSSARCPGSSRKKKTKARQATLSSSSTNDDDDDDDDDVDDDLNSDTSLSSRN